MLRKIGVCPYFPHFIMKILITAGPTVESIDPVRFISNLSTGVMGYELAAASIKRGFEVCLVSGPVRLSPPEGAEVVNVTTARQMRDEVIKRIDYVDCVIMAAAVCDFRPADAREQKIKKGGKIVLELAQNPDILKEIGKRKGLVKAGFALETENAVENAGKKLDEKGLDLIVVNKKGAEEDPFGNGEKTFTLIDKARNTRTLEGVTKDKCAEIILDTVEQLTK